MGIYYSSKMNSLIKISIILAVSALANSKAVLRSAPRNCDGYEDADFVVLGGNSPDEIPIPGEITMDINQLIRHDLPADLVLKMDLTKLEPFPLDVPCLNGLGSCEYDFCKILVDNGDQLCDQMPPGQPCHCPLLKNEWDMKGVTVPIPDFGLLNNLMVGSYKSRATFYGKSTPDNKVGCMEFEYTFVKG